jgi:hypothetical protein
MSYLPFFLILYVIFSGVSGAVPSALSESDSFWPLSLRIASAQSPWNPLRSIFQVPASGRVIDFSCLAWSSVGEQLPPVSPVNGVGSGTAADAW